MATSDAAPESPPSSVRIQTACIAIPVNAKNKMNTKKITSIRAVTHSPLSTANVFLRNFCIDALDESGGVGVRPVGMLRFEVGANLFSSVVGRYALALERERPRTDSRDQFYFRGHERTIPGSAMIGQNMRGIERGYLVQHRKPARRRAAVPEDVGYGLVLHYVAGDQGAVGFNKSQLIAFGVSSAEPEQAGRTPPRSTLASWSNITSGGRKTTPASSSLFCGVRWLNISIIS